MNFKTRKISKKEPKPPRLPKEPLFSNPFKKKLIRINLGLLGSLIILTALFFGIAKAVSMIDLKIFLKVAGESLETDSYGHTNFLILGTGGEGHEGADLTDTIIVASMDDNNKLISMISIPRDTYVKDQNIGSSRINEVYYNAKKYYGNEAEGLDHLKSKVETIMGVPIHYWILIDFKGFKEIIDAIGGVDIDVKTAIYDPYYPKDGTFLYETFSISTGPHHLDGKTALKYARSRKTTSDFDRANRQQEIIYAMKEKALQTKIILSQEKITNILTALKNNIETNISVKEILTLGAMAGDYSKDRISHKLIHDDPTQCGGFLYTPSREAYNGMFVLIPAGGFDFIHQYSDLNFNMSQLSQEHPQIQILNGTRRGGSAGETKQILQRFCFDIVRFGNADRKDITQTTYYYKPLTDSEGETSRPATLDFLQKLIPGVESTQIPPEYLEKGYMDTADIILELGSDYTDSEKYLKDPFYYLPAIIPTTPAADATTPAADATTTTAPPTEAPAVSTPQSATP